MKFVHVLCMVVIVPVVAASEMVVVKTGVTACEDFNGFQGTFESLPPGFAVSNTGSNCLTAADSDEFKPPHSGGTSEGACRPWDLGGGDYALGYQPTLSEFTPGFFLVTVSNATGEAVTLIEVSYEIVCYNNENRSSSLDLEYSLDGTAFTRVGSAGYSSPAREDPEPYWKTCRRSASIELAKPMQPGARFWIRWYGDDDGGSGSRDEYGIDDVAVALRSRRGTVIVVP